MIRKLKALMLAGMALAVFGALGVSSAQAHTPALFHSHLEETTLTVKTDGTGKTTHSVFDAPGGGSVTCAGTRGHGLVKGKTVESITVTLEFYQACTAFGQAAEVSTANCSFTFFANGKIKLGGEGCNLFVKVPVTGCEIKFTTPKEYTGITYHNINVLEGPTVEGTATYTTVSAAVANIVGSENGAGCPAPGAFTTGEFTTGNAIVEGEKVGTTEMTSVWWTPTVP